MSVFVTDSGYKHTLGIVRSLGHRGLKVDVGSSSVHATLASFSKYCQRSFIYPDPKNYPDRFIRFLRILSEESKYKVVMPVSYTATFCMSKNKKALDKFVNVPIADFSSLKIAANKRDTMFLAEKIGVPAPKTFNIQYVSQLDEVDGWNYPLVVKGSVESGFVHYARNKQELKQYFEAIYRVQGVAPVVQEFITGEGYGFFALFNHGKPRAVFMHKRVREAVSSGGPSTCAESVYEPKLLDYGLRILKALKWHGVAMVEFKKDSTDGEFKLMEINPKFWGSLDLSIACGVDFPYLLYRMAVNGDIASVFNYKLGVRFVWPFADLQHVINTRRDAATVLLDVLNRNVKKNLDRTDLKPTLFPLIDGLSLISSKLFGF